MSSLGDLPRTCSRGVWIVNTITPRCSDARKEPPSLALPRSCASSWFGINPGDDILLGLRQAVKEHAIRNAAILTGFGSVRHSHFHVVMSNDLPPAESYPKSAQPFDVVAIGGLIIDGRVPCGLTPRAP